MILQTMAKNPFFSDHQKNVISNHIAYNVNHILGGSYLIDEEEYAKRGKEVDVEDNNWTLQDVLEET